MEKHGVGSGLPHAVCCGKYLESDFVYKMNKIYTFIRKTSYNKIVLDQPQLLRRLEFGF